MIFRSAIELNYENWLQLGSLLPSYRSSLWIKSLVTTLNGLSVMHMSRANHESWNLAKLFE